MVSLDDKVRALAVTAGWKSPRPGQDGSYSFRLEDGLDLKVFSPDGRLCFLLAGLRALRVPVDVPQQEFDDAVRDFLNDLAWWKKSLGDSPREELPPMFSMPGTFFGGVY